MENENITSEAVENEIPAEQAEAAKPVLDPGKAMMRRHLAELVRKGESLQKSFGEADMKKLLCDRRFLLMTSPLVGLSPEDAYFALNREVMQRRAVQYTAKRCAEQYAQAVMSGSLRPIENGISAVGACPESALAQTPKERAALRERIRRAAVFGKKIFPG